MARMGRRKAEDAAIDVRFVLTENAKMKLKSSNAGFFRPATVVVSTAKLPIEINGRFYETCVFAGKDSEVVERYSSVAEAVAGHARNCIVHGIFNVWTGYLN